MSTLDPLPPIVQTFLNYLQHQKRYSQHTLQAYEHDLRLLIQHFPDQDITQLSNESLRFAVARLHAKGRSPRTLARITSSWRSFYHWYTQENAVPINPAKDLKSPKLPRQLPKALTVEQTQYLLDHPPESDTLIRDQAMFELLYSCGLRLSELVSLDMHYCAHPTSLSWLNQPEQELHIYGKGQKTRIVPIGQKAMTAIMHWLQERPQWANEKSGVALFLGVRGARITPRVVELQLQKYAQTGPLHTHLHPHILRHSFASHLLQSSQDIRAVQELLGHANISTTQIYTRLDFQHLARAYEQAHPRAKRKS